MCKQTSRTLHILYVLDTLALLLFICPWTRQILLYPVKPLTMNYLKVHFFRPKRSSCITEHITTS